MLGALGAALVVLLSGAGTVFVGRWLGSAGDPATLPAQNVPFLSGGEPHMHAWGRFHARFYAMTLIFIAFEMEMMFMYPWAVVYVEEGFAALVDMGIFLTILSLGILYGWREGAFRWQ